MNTISETDLIDAIRNKAIKRLNIVQTEDRKFRIVVTLAKVSIAGDWKEGDLSLISTRNAPREWASLDRLEKHIRSRYGAIPVISLSLNFELED